MKRTALAMMLFIMATLVLVDRASAQSTRFDIPFEFRIGDRIYDADTYLIAPLGSVGYSLMSQNGRGQLLVGHIPEIVDREGKCQLVFQCHNNDCALKTVKLVSRAFTLSPKSWQPNATVRANSRMSDRTVVAKK